MRDEWRTLNRGAGEDPSDELQLFQAAADRAYEPCREHFARQADLRKENQERREALLERLTAFAAEQAGEHPNWRAINQAIVELRREWRQYTPVDQAIAKPLRARFHAVVDELQGRLDAEYARNVQAKRDLIAHTAELLNLEDTRKAIDETKNLQRTWKSVGIVPWSLDNVLWDEFRQQCDAVFQRSSQEAAAYAVTLEANHAQATAVCEELERIAGLDRRGRCCPPFRNWTKLCAKSMSWTCRERRRVPCSNAFHTRPTVVLRPSADTERRRRAAAGPMELQPLPGSARTHLLPYRDDRQLSVRRCGRRPRLRSPISPMRPRPCAAFSSSGSQQLPPARSTRMSPRTKRHCDCCASARN